MDTSNTGSLQVGRIGEIRPEDAPPWHGRPARASHGHLARGRTRPRWACDARPRWPCHGTEEAPVGHPVLRISTPLAIGRSNYDQHHNVGISPRRSPFDKLRAKPRWIAELPLSPLLRGTYARSRPERRLRPFPPGNGPATSCRGRHALLEKPFEVTGYTPMSCCAGSRRSSALPAIWHDVCGKRIDGVRRGGARLGKARSKIPFHDIATGRGAGRWR